MEKEKRMQWLSKGTDDRKAGISFTSSLLPKNQSKEQDQIKSERKKTTIPQMRYSPSKFGYAGTATDNGSLSFESQVFTIKSMIN